MGKFNAVTRLTAGIFKNTKLTNFFKSDKMAKLTNAIKCGKMKQRYLLFKDFKMCDRDLDKFEILEKVENFQTGCIMFGGIGALGCGMLTGVHTKEGAKCLDKAFLALSLGALGFAIGGPIGAITGNIIGLLGNLGIGEWIYEYENNKKTNKETPSQENEKINVKA